jgi:CysZ protein
MLQGRNALSARPRNLRLSDGLDAVCDGLTFIVTTPSVWGYALVPLAILGLLSCGLTGVGLWGASWLTETLRGEEVSTWGRIGGWVLTVLLGAVAILAAIVAAVMLAQPLSGPALERIVLARERALTGHATHGTSFLLSFLNTFKAVTLALLTGGPILVLLFAISTFFPPAAVVTVPLKFLVTAWMLAWDFIDYPLGLRGVGLDARLCWVGRNFLAFTLFGMGWATLLLVPGVFLIVLPMGVAGATHLVLRAERLQQPAPREEVPEVLPASF